MPSPGSPSSGEQGQQSGEERAKAERETAGGDLQAAGERVASAGEQLGKQGEQSGQQGESAGSDNAEASQGGNEPEDPFLPEMDPTGSQSDDLVFDESEAGGARGGEMASADAAGGDNGAAGDPAAGDPAAGGDPMAQPSADTMETAGGSMGGDEISDEIRAAQEALMEAGVRLQEAGAAVAGAASEADLARAQELLAEARVITIVAGQDLMDASEAAGDSDEYRDAEAALNDANAAIVVATQAVEGMPDFEDMQTAGTPGGNTGLEDELEDSLGDFDKKILTARRTVLQSGGQRNPELPPADDEMPAGIPGSTADEPGLAEVDGDSEGPPEPGSLPVSRATEGEQVASAGVPDDIGPGNDDDIVAQQLREAAMAESDPELREKLWEEYRRYKSGL